MDGSVPPRNTPSPKQPVTYSDKCSRCSGPTYHRSGICLKCRRELGKDTPTKKPSEGGKSRVYKYEPAETPRGVQKNIHYWKA